MAPDLRGYNQSACRKGISAYAGKYLVQDVIEIIDQHAEGRAFVVDHDWGASAPGD